MKEKHMHYYSFLDACKEKECPVCYLVHNRIEKYYDDLIYSGINDVGFRNIFRKNDGFCNHHSYKFSEYNHGLAIAITHKDLILNKLQTLKKKSASHDDKKHKTCIVCEEISGMEERFISIFLDYIDDDEMTGAFLSSEGLCIPHFEILLGRVKKNLPEKIIEFHIKHYERLAEGLERYINSKNVTLGDRRPVLTDEEELIWKKAVKVFNGW